MSPNPRLRVLIVDDNDDTAQSLALGLRLHGHEVFVAGTGTLALTATAQHQVQAVILDLNLPDLDGREVARQLRRSWGNRLRLIALTGEPDAEDALFDRFLLKPVDLEMVEQNLWD